MSIDSITNKKGISAIGIISTLAIILSGNGLYNDTNQEEADIILIENTIDSKISQHEAYATPHAPYDVKFELLKEHIALDIQFKKDVLTKMDDYHEKSSCRDQQLKDLFYNVPESDC